MESEKGSTFSKASFASSANRSDINIDDPDFWNKWAKKAEIDTTEKDETEDLVISEPRRRTQIKRYGHDESAIDMSELESSSDSDLDNDGLSLGMRSRRSKLKKKRLRGDDYIPREGERSEIVYGSWARRECFMVERGLLTFGWGRWQEILQHSQLRKGWREQDVEDCARVILLYCLRFYRGDEKIRSFIWDLIAPSENGEQKISRNHHGLKDPVPRGIRNKNKKKGKDNRHAALTDPNHWSKSEKYDGDIFLESNYKKHLGRHANKVLLRVRMLYYIKHEIIGDLVQHIADGVHASNDDDLDDEDTNEESSLKSKNRDASEANSEVAEPSPGPSASSETQPPDGDERDEIGDDKPSWPTITDLNTRLRRVITSYQRNYRKEEQKLAAAKAKPSIEPALSSPLAALAQVSQQFDVRDAAALGLQGWDLQQLALYLLMERQGKQAMEAALRERDRERERERSTISKRWTKREEADFFRVASSYGVIYYRKKKSYDWTKFKQLAKLEKKSDDELTEYYKHFVMMCKKQTGGSTEDINYDTTIEHISEEKARRTLERLELLSRIREEIITHPKLDERLKVCVTSADMPDWWIAGKHDKDLLLGVAKHGLGRTDYYLLNDPDLSFQEVLRKKVNSETVSSEAKDAIKLESHEDILKFDKDEILVKLEKGEGTLKIEKVAVKKEGTEEKEKKVEESSKVELTIVKSEKGECEDKGKSEESSDKPESEEGAKEKKVSSSSATEETEETPEAKSKAPDNKEEPGEATEEKEVVQKPDEETTEKVAEKTAEDKPASEIKKTEETPPEVKEKVEIKPAKTQYDEESDLCSKQAAELKAMFPDLEVIQPLSRLSQVDTFVLRDKQGTGALDFSETTVAQLFNNAVKWPKEYAIQVRLQHIIYAVETKEWPATKSFSAYATGIGNEIDIPVHELPNDPPKRDSSTPMSVGDADVIAINDRSNLNKKRKRHIAIDVETERAKLHALLNSSHITNPKHGLSSWDEDSEDSRRSTPVQSNLQPPPAHQQTSRLMSLPYDKYHSPKTIGQTTVIPGTSSTLTPIDLSSSITKSSDKNNLDIQNEVQDFSMPSKKQQQQQSSIGGMKSGNKLDDTLSKLMKRKNCPVEEPVVGKEKKRRKLDEIVLGLSAAKEQSLFPESSKKPPVTPSVTVTPTSAPVSSSHNISQKPFTITVTSVPSTAPSSRNSSVPNILPSSMSSTSTSKDSFSTFLAQAEQQNLLLKKQQQQRKSYEAMIADIGKVSDFSSKVNSYSHEAKVNKWLAEQNAALAEQPLGADYLSPRRRRPRIDPTLLDWKKLTGDENVSVIHRVSGKKLTGPKAPTLKRLGQWLVENPMYDIDPKWAELVKERGNLSHDLQKRVPGSNNGKKSGAPGRPPLLSSPTGSTSSVSSANINTSIPSSLSFPSLSASSLSGINSNLLSGLSGLGQFDPKNNPLLMPFAGLPNMNALSSMGGLGNLTNMNLFANLAGLGLPGLGGMDAASLSGDSKNSSSKNSNTKPQTPKEAHSNSKSQSSGNSSIPTTNPFPFFFPNPSLLYTPLGLGGLNPFTLQPGMSAAYDTLAQQCGLLNGSLNTAASPNSSMKTSKSSSSSRPSSSSTVTTSTATSGANNNKPLRSSSREAQLQQLLLPPDTQILESISKAASSLDPSLKQTKSDKKEDKRKALESLRGMLPTDFTTSPDKYKDKKLMPGLADFTKLLEAQTSGGSKKSQEQQMKEAIEQLSKNNAELMTKSVIGEESSSAKRPRDFAEDGASTEENPAKKMKESPSPQPQDKDKSTNNQTGEQEGVDIETLLPPSTVVKSVCVNVEKTQDKQKESTESEEKKEQSPPPPASKESETKEAEEKKEEATPAPPPADNPPESPPKKSTKRTRGKRKSGELPPIDPEAIIEKKNLRSSASRSAAAAAARAAAEQAAAAKQAEAENAQKLQESSESAS